MNSIGSERDPETRSNSIETINYSLVVQCEVSVEWRWHEGNRSTICSKSKRNSNKVDTRMRINNMHDELHALYGMLSSVVRAAGGTTAAGAVMEVAARADVAEGRTEKAGWNTMMEVAARADVAEGGTKKGGWNTAGVSVVSRNLLSSSVSLLSLVVFSRLIRHWKLYLRMRVTR
jgi:hypothetical protein